MAEILSFPDMPAAAAREDAEVMLRSVCDAHLQAFQHWLLTVRQGRDDAALEIEVFAASARQLVLRRTKPE